MRVFFHPEARDEALAAATFYESQQPGLGRRFLDALAAVISRIETHPGMYPEIESSVRQARISPFTQGVIFRVSGSRIDVVAVMHLRREPGYWRSRSFEGEDR